MREVKFKAQKADKSGWISGFYWASLDPCSEQTKWRGHYIHSGCNIENPIEIKPETLCQYLFTNTNGIEVYENDKIKGEEDGEFYVIKWSGYGYTVDTYGYNISCGEWSQEIIDSYISVIDEDSFGVDELIECEIIGNIHDKN